MVYSVFESLEASESEHRIASSAAMKDLDKAIAAVKLKHGRYLNNANSQDDFFGRVANVKDDMRKIVQSFGIFPAKSPMRKVVGACRNDARPQWLQRQAAEGTSVDDVAPSPETTSPVGVLDDSPVGAVLGRRTAAFDPDNVEDREAENELHRRHDERGGEGNPDPREFWHEGRRVIAEDQLGYEGQPYVPTDTTSGELGTGVLATNRVGGGFRDFLQQGLRGLAEGMEPEATGGGWRGELMRGFDQGIEGELPPEIGGPPQHPPLPKGHGGHDWKQEGLEGFRDGISQGLRGASFQQVLAEADRMSGGGLADAPALIPEGSFDAYLNSVTGEETNKAQSHPFGSREGDDNWVNTAMRRVHGDAGPTVTLLHPTPTPKVTLLQPTDPQPNPNYQPTSARHAAEDYVFGGKDQYDFTGSPETQHHHRALPEGGWGAVNQVDDSEDAIYDLMHQGMDFDTARAQVMKGAAVLYADWAHDNGAHAGSHRTALAWGHRVGAKKFSHLLQGVHLAQGIRRTAAGKDHLTTSQDAITKMLNELAEDFQKSIMPLQDALQSVQFAQQSMAAQQSPMNVMPPGSVNVLPQGMDPAAGGAPMQGQSMPAQPGPGGMSPMVDPNATGGAPAPGADPAMMGGAPPGGDPAAGGAPPEPAQRPTASSNPLRPLGKKKEWYEDDDDDSDDEPDKDDGFGGKKAPPFGKKDSRRRYAGENPFADGGPPKDDDSDDDEGDPPEKKKDGPPEHGDGPPPGPPPPGHDGGGDPIEGLPEFQAFCEANEIPYDQLGPEDQEEVKQVFVDVIQQLQADGGEQGSPPPPQGLPPGPPPPEQGPPPEMIARRQANAFLKWAKYYDLPINKKTAAYFVQGSEGASRGRRPLA